MLSASRQKYARALHIVVMAMALFTLVSALVMHSHIISPSIFTDGAYRAPSSMDLYINDELVERDTALPQTIVVEDGDVIRLSGIVEDFDTRHLSFMLVTDASIYRVYANGVQVASDDTHGQVSGFFRMHHGSPQMHIGFFPDGMDVSRIDIEFECGSVPDGRHFNIDSLVLGSSWDLISIYRNTLRLSACLLVMHFTILVVLVIIMITMRRPLTSRLMLVILLEILMIVQSVVNMGVRDLLYSNEYMWQVLDQVSSVPYPLIFLALLYRIDRMSFLSSPRHRLIALIPATLLALSGLAAPFSLRVSHMLFHMTKGSCLAVCIAYTITLALRRMKGDNHLLSFALMMDTAMMLEIVNVPSFDTFNLLHSVSNILRLAAVITYITFTISRYLTNERIVIGQIELDDMLYRDSLTGCLNRRNLEQLRSEEGSIAGVRFYMLYYDLDELKLINDSFGHGEGDRIFMHLGETIRSFFGKGRSTFRCGGDEFLTLVPADEGIIDVGAMAEAFCAAFSKDAPYSATLSIGWALYEGGGQEEFDLRLEQADRMMYTQKKAHHERHRSEVR